MAAGATCIASLCSVPLYQAAADTAAGADVSGIVAALAAKNIGGGLNFLAVAAALRVDDTMLALGLAADSIVGIVYFLGLNAWAARLDRDDTSAIVPVDDGGDDDDDDDTDRDAAAAAAVRADSILLALAAALSLVVASTSLCALLHLDPSNAVAVSSGLAVLCASGLASPAAARVLGSDRAARGVQRAAELAGGTMLSMYFATAGAAAANATLSTTATTTALLGPMLLAVAALYAIHATALLAAGRLLRVPPRLLALGSNAAIGGPATAAAMAAARGWPQLLPPALICGNIGNAVATPLVVLGLAPLIGRLA